LSLKDQKSKEKPFPSTFTALESFLSCQSQHLSFVKSLKTGFDQEDYL
jgi:hypothetical protein